MPLLHGKSDNIVQANYKELRGAGYPDDQAWAISFSKAGRNKKKVKKAAKKVAKHKKKGIK